MQDDNPFTDKVVEALSKVSGIEEITTYYNLPASSDLEAQESDAAIIGFTQQDMELLQTCTANGTMPDYGVMASKNQLVVGKANDFESYFGIQPEVGKTVTLKIFDGDKSENMQFDIAAILDQNKIGDNSDKIDMLLLPLDSINRIANCNTVYEYAIRVETSAEQQAEQEITQIVKDNPRLEVETLSGAIAQNENFIQAAKLALAVAIVFIGCFAIINMLNTILTGIIVRRKEFALMRSVGMSQKQLASMVRCEGLITVSFGLVLSICIGGGIGYVLCSFLKNGLMSYLNYHFPFGVTAAFCLLVILCTLAISEAALKNQGKSSLIELLRE